MGGSVCLGSKKSCSHVQTLKYGPPSLSLSLSLHLLHATRMSECKLGRYNGLRPWQ